MWGPIVAVILLLILVPIAIAGKSFAPWVPTWKQDVERALHLAKLQPGEVLYDLGSGDGKVVFIAAQQFAANAKGIELAWPLWLWSKLRRAFSSPNVKANTQFILGNLFSKNISDADVVFVFGMPKHLKDKLRLKLEQELKPGARVVSYSFAIADWTPVIKDKPTPKQIAVFLYQR